MGIVRIASLVEGHGEVESLPILLRRILSVMSPGIVAEVARPFRHPSGSIRKPGGLERAISAVAIQNPGYAILVLIDSDDDCPRELANDLLVRATIARPDLCVSVVLAEREFESWFIAAAPSLSGIRNLRAQLTCPENSSSIRDAKGWLTDHMTDRRCYSPTVDQAALTSCFDLELAKSSRSFRKLWSDLDRMAAKQD